MDSAAEVGGQGQGIRPMEMVLLGLGGCTGIDVVSILQKMRVPFDRFEIAVDGERADEHPKIYRHIRVRYQFWGEGLDSDKVWRAVSLSQDKYCSVSAMLKQAATMEASVEINGQRVEKN
ncbi:OsmC family protein [Sulfobacillus sp. DSM 109850]|uniref:OsmC family protein n=2 Tax=Sulfobacillus harzensis TaxID=2729629 RepID=A0A7Y0L2X8_9FIRM|nr:OsmC family protein [Sulfobacillus harzensis]